MSETSRAGPIHKSAETSAINSAALNRWFLVLYQDLGAPVFD
jgi:hypothetical protein